MRMGGRLSVTPTLVSHGFSWHAEMGLWPLVLAGRSARMW